jgi:hypothetical protein
MYPAATTGHLMRRAGALLVQFAPGIQMCAKGKNEIKLFWDE